MKALTIKAPWAWAIIHAGKDAENRTWATSYRGPLAIHSSGACARAYWGWARDWMAKIGVSVPALDELLCGHVIGYVDIVDCVRDSSSPWAMTDHWHWVLANPRACEPFPARGSLGLWNLQAAS